MIRTFHEQLTSQVNQPLNMSERIGLEVTVHDHVIVLKFTPGYIHIHPMTQAAK